MSSGRDSSTEGPVQGKRVLVATTLAILLFLVACSSVRADGGGTHLFRGLNAPGLTAAQNKAFGVPPDTTGAIGRSGYLESVNVRLGLFATAGLQPMSSLDAHAFWRQPASGTVVDPQVAWDDGARRWYAAELFNPRATGNELLFAWSKTPDPDLISGWCTMAIPTGKLFDDFPKLGFSRNHIVIGTNVSNLGTRTFEFARLWVIGKPLAGDTSCAEPPVTSFGSKANPLRGVDGHVATTLVGVNPVHPSANAYVISADCPGEPTSTPDEPSCESRDPGSNQISVWHVHGPRSSPVLTRDGAVRVRRYKEPRPVPQPHSKLKLDASDTRLTQATSAPDPTRGGRIAIWTQHAVAGPRGRSIVRWYELDPHRLSLIRHGRVASPHNWVFNAAISPNWRGSGAAIDYNVAGRHLLPQIRARSRGASTATNRMRHPVLIGRSAAPYRCDLDPGDACPWGDYSSATPDPRHPTVVWGSNQVQRSRKHAGPLGSSWGTRNFAVKTRR